MVSPNNQNNQYACKPSAESGKKSTGPGPVIVEIFTWPDKYLLDQRLVHGTEHLTYRLLSLCR